VDTELYAFGPERSLLVAPVDPSLGHLSSSHEVEDSGDLVGVERVHLADVSDVGSDP